jgi:hypothetical protein
LAAEPERSLEELDLGERGFGRLRVLPGIECDRREEVGGPVEHAA